MPCTVNYSLVGPKQHGTENCHKACLKSLTDLQTEYLDLYLIHWPGVQGVRPDDPRNVLLRKETWAAMENLYNEGVH